MFKFMRRPFKLYPFINGGGSIWPEREPVEETTMLVQEKLLEVFRARWCSSDRCSK